VLAKVRYFWDRLHQLRRTGAAQLNETEKPAQGTEAGLGVTGSVSLRTKLRVAPNILNADVGPACFVVAELPREIMTCKRDISFYGQTRKAPMVLQKYCLVIEPGGPWLARLCCVALAEF